MAIPDFQSIMLPLLQSISDGKEYTNSEIVEALARHFNLSEDEKRELLPSGTQEKFSNRVHWAKAHFKMAGLIESPRRSWIRITARGQDILSKKPPIINLKFLRQFPEYITRVTTKKENSTQDDAGSDEPTISGTPSEMIEIGYERWKAQLETEILEQVKKCSPLFFEKLVVELLVKMGYGGSRVDAGRAIGGSGDGGIDGIIKEDKLGLDVVYIQAKRWEDTPIGRPEVQKFVGALAGQKARKGVFITTSRFTNEAKQFAAQVDSKIVLIDGEQLARFMIEHDVGLSTVVTYRIKKIDTDYFTEE